MVQYQEVHKESIDGAAPLTAKKQLIQTSQFLRRIYFYYSSPKLYPFWITRPQNFAVQVGALYGLVSGRYLAPTNKSGYYFAREVFSISNQEPRNMDIARKLYLCGDFICAVGTRVSLVRVRLLKYFPLYTIFMTVFTFLF